MYSKQSFTQLLRKDAEARLVCRKVKLTAKRIRFEDNRNDWVQAGCFVLARTEL